jgi:hypothetical protein
VALVHRIANFLDEQHIDFAPVDARVLSVGTWEPFRPLATIEVRPGDFDDPLRGVVWIRPPKQRKIDIVVGRWKWQQKVIARAANSFCRPLATDRHHCRPYFV